MSTNEFEERFSNIDAETRKQYLEKALQARKEMAELCCALKAGTISVEKFFAEDNTKTANIRISRAIKSVPNLGSAKTRYIMDAMGFSETKRLRGLGKKQREKLVHILSESAKGNYSSELFL